MVRNDEIDDHLISQITTHIKSKIKSIKEKRLERDAPLTA